MVRAGGEIMDTMYDLEDGDTIPEEYHDYFTAFFPFTIGDVTLLRIPRGRPYTLDPSPCDPHRVIISYNTNIEVTLYVTKFLMESRRLYCGEPWFVNGHHRVVFEAPVLRDALLVHIICDSSVREHIRETPF